MVNILKTIGWFLFQKSITHLFSFNVGSSQVENKIKRIRFTTRKCISTVWLDYPKFHIVYFSGQDKKRERRFSECFLCAFCLLLSFPPQSRQEWWVAFYPLYSGGNGGVGMHYH